MTIPSEPHVRRLQFYATAPYTCSYLPNMLAQSLIAAPHHYIDSNAYDGLIEQGFRRSGKFAYRPHCENCNACIPVRIPVADFITNRSQKRAFKKHQTLSTYVLPLNFNQEHFELYQHYQNSRHCSVQESEENIGKHDTNETEFAKDQYKNFLAQSNVETVMIEFRQDGMLKMVSVVDIVRNGISAVYTFYDTLDKHTSYGVYNILWQINWAKSLKIEFLYLGYWIQQSKKMAYKQNYMPQEALIDGTWQALKF